MRRKFLRYTRALWFCALSVITLLPAYSTTASVMGLDEEGGEYDDGEEYQRGENAKSEAAAQAYRNENAAADESASHGNSRPHEHPNLLANHVINASVCIAAFVCLIPVLSGSLSMLSYRLFLKHQDFRLLIGKK